MIEIREKEEGAEISCPGGWDNQLITEEQLQALLDGKKLEYNNGEYSCILGLNRFWDKESITKWFK